MLANACKCLKMLANACKCLKLLENACKGLLLLENACKCLPFLPAADFLLPAAEKSNDEANRKKENANQDANQNLVLICKTGGTRDCFVTPKTKCKDEE